MQCPRCQHENPPGARFCNGCGARAELACAQCGQVNPSGSRFCNGCGAKLGDPAPAGPQARFASPETYTPKHLAERILTSRAALEGERKQVTVLFADLKGSMELLADRDPEEARKILDPVLERLMEAVHRYEGTVNQVMGDGIMALFGAPLAHEDHAVRACYAALDMQAAIRRYAEEVRRAQGVKVQIRVGLNSGEVVVRAIGSDLHMDYTAVGQTTHLAARMEQLADPGAILLTADTLRLAEGYVEVRPLGPVPVKGLDAPVEVYEIIAAGPLRSRLHAAAARGLTRFVGRETELEQLRRALGRAAISHGQVVAIVGEAGVGKSRLVWEVTHSHRTHGWSIVQAGSVSYGKATSYHPVIGLLKGYFQIEDRDEPRKIHEKVAGKLLTLDRALEPTLAAFLALLDVPVEEAQWQALDPPQRRLRTLDAVKRLLIRESQVQPLLVVFEDLHWIDTETQALLDSLVESLPTARVFLLVNYRPEYQHGWGSKSYYTQLRLDPLPPESVEELLRALLGDDPGLQPLRRLLIDRTEGNPFFLEESVWTLVETGVLVGERGAYRLAKAIQAALVPPTVQAVLAARIDRLPPEDKRLLQTASVIGKDVPFPLLEAVAGQPDEELRRRLAHLQAAEFLYETSLFPDLEFTFKHALTHQVAYSGLLQARRRALHARIAEAIEVLYPDRLSEQPDSLAYHAFRGELWDKAVVYLRRAGTKAAARLANREAVTRFQEALAALQHLPESRMTIEQAVDLLCDLRNADLQLGEHQRMIEHMRAAEPLAMVLNDQGRLALVLSYASVNFHVSGEHDRAIGAGERALAITAGLGDIAFEACASVRLAFPYYCQGDYRRALDLNRRSIELVTGDLMYQALTGPSLTSVLSRHWLVRCLSETGEFREALTRAKEAVRIAEAVDNANSLAFAREGLGGLYLQRGDLSEAVVVLEAAVQLCRATDINQMLPWAAARLGLAYDLCGLASQSLPLREQAVESTKGFGERSRTISLAGEGYLLAGQIGDAMKLAEQALRLSRTSKERGFEAWALRLLGEISARRDPPEVERAESHYREALVLAAELGMRPLVAHCHLGLGKLYRRKGKRQEAQERLTTATTMYREMDMPYWLEQAETEMKDFE